MVKIGAIKGRWKDCARELLSSILFFMETALMRRPGAPGSSSIPDGSVEGLEVAKHLESCRFLNSYMKMSNA